MTAEEALAYFSEWKKAYQLAFGAAADTPAFADLAAFCHASSTCEVRGDRDHGLILEGRRQAHLRLTNFLNLTPEQLVKLHTQPAKGAISDE